VRALVFDSFAGPLDVREVPDPEPPPGGVVVRVAASGICRSDWHAWQGHDPDVVLPHVPGHELAGTVAEVGSGVRGWAVGDRVTVPFVCACGDCRECRAGDHQVCPYQQQPGFTYWGSFAEYVAVPYAEVNLVRLPDEIGFTAAASLGCRFATAYRGVARVGAALPGEWLVVFGCGGVGLSAVMIGNALGARVVAVDVSESALAAAAGFGAEHTVRAGAAAVGRLRELTDGGPQVTVDAIGAVDVVQQALSVLRPRGRHVQLGLLPGAVTLEVSALIARELRWVGSHGLAAHDYPALLELVRSGAVRPDALVGREIGLADASAALVELDRGRPTGMTVIRP